MADKALVLKRAAAAVLTAGAAALASILGYEGVSNSTYVDTGGVLTNCVGHTGKDVKRGATASDEVCATLLATDADKAASGVRKAIHAAISPEEFDAYTSLAFNIGVPAFTGSTLVKKVNAGDRKGGCEQILRWVYDNGKLVKGLQNRRASEYVLCMQGLARSK